MTVSRSLARIAVWGATLLLVALFVSSAVPKLAPSDAMTARFAAWGLPSWLVPVVGVAEGLGGLLLLPPSTALYGALLLGLVMIGAVATHLLSGIGSPAFAALALGALGLVGWHRRNDAWHRARATREAEEPRG